MIIEITESQLEIICEALETYASKAHRATLRFDYSSCVDVYNIMTGFKSRGLRNNNPFNIKKSSHPWIGKKSVSDDSTFEQFTNMYYGIRAGMKLLCNYVTKGFDTPRKIIERYAPCCENATSAYLDFITHDSGNKSFVGVDEPITDIYTLCKLASRMVAFENAASPILLDNISCLPEQLVRICNFYKFKLNVK